MEDDLITTKEVGDYRIKVYYCHDSECPITNWGLFGSFFFEYSDTHRLHDECNWKTFFYDNKHDLRDVIDAIVMKHIKQKDIVKYLKKGEANEISFTYNRGDNVWELKHKTSPYIGQEFFPSDLKDFDYIIYEDGHAEPFTGDNSKDCVRYIGLKHRYMSFAISLTEHDIVQLLDDDSREESGSGTYYERECDALFDIDGRGNTERLVARNPKLRNLLEDGEYIPSLGQLNLMAHYMNELNKAFAYVSASPLSSTWYWSSTESSQAVAWYVVFSSGLTGTGNKHIGDMVRAVIDF